jgi:acetoin utilization protein AcuB
MKLSDFQHMPQVASLMTPFPHFVEPEEPIGGVARLMEKESIHHIPVKRAGEVVGLVSSAAVSLAQQDGLAERAWCAGDLQTGPSCVVDFSAPLNEALRALAEHHTDAAVVTKDGHLAGILTVTDVCDALCELLEDRFSELPDGAA